MNKEMKWKAEKLIVSNLLVDTTYQRELNLKRVKELAEKWDTAFVNAPLVSRRDNGELYCLDGNHTRMASIKVYGENSKMNCRVFEGLTVEDEARIFEHYNSAAKRLTYNEKFKALIASGDEDANKYIKMLDEMGLKYSFTNRGGRGIVCHAALFTAYKNYPKDTVKEALRSVGEMWANGIEFLRADIVTGVIKFFVVYDNKFSIDRFEASVSKVPMNELERMAGNYKSSISYSGAHDGTYMAMVFVDIYNKGLRKNRLEITEIKGRK